MTRERVKVGVIESKPNETKEKQNGHVYRNLRKSKS